jgi:PiT family inorganic phosphate transporter
MDMSCLAVTAAASGGPTQGAALGLVFGIIAVALVFDFLNGFHDAANSIATVVSTRVLTPSQAVLWAAFFNFAAAFLFGTSVAKTIAEKLIDTNQIDVYVMLAGLTGAIVWNIITWLLALPTSSSHALMAGFGGAAVAKGGLMVILPLGWVLVLLGIVLSPMLGFLLGSFAMIAVAWITSGFSMLIRWLTPQRVDHLYQGAAGRLRKLRPWRDPAEPPAPTPPGLLRVAGKIYARLAPSRLDGVFRRLQLVSAGIYSLGHGANDAQKTMGIIAIVLTTAGYAHWTTYGRMQVLGTQHAAGYGMPIILACHAAIALGTIFGGWRIVKTMGSGITRLQPVGGFCAEMAAATTIIGFTKLGGVPISTTHAITGAILGVGTTKGVRSVRWIWGERIVVAWMLTIPCSAFIGAVMYMAAHWLIQPLFH